MIDTDIFLLLTYPSFHFDLPSFHLLLSRGSSTSYRHYRLVHLSTGSYSVIFLFHLLYTLLLTWPCHFSFASTSSFVTFILAAISSFYFIPVPVTLEHILQTLSTIYIFILSCLIFFISSG